MNEYQKKEYIYQETREGIGEIDTIYTLNQSDMCLSSQYVCLHSMFAWSYVYSLQESLACNRLDILVHKSNILWEVTTPKCTIYQKVNMDQVQCSNIFYCNVFA